MIKEQNKCPICHEVFETGDFITGDVDMSITDWNQCPGCEEMISMGFVVLIEAKEDREEDDEIPSTGNYYFLPDEIFQHIFKMEIPEDSLGMIFVEEAEYPKLCKKHKSNLH